MLKHIFVLKEEDVLIEKLKNKTCRLRVRDDEDYLKKMKERKRGKREQNGGE